MKKTLILLSICFAVVCLLGSCEKEEQRAHNGNSVPVIKGKKISKITQYYEYQLSPEYNHCKKTYFLWEGELLKEIKEVQMINGQESVLSREILSYTNGRLSSIDFSNTSGQSRHKVLVYTGNLITSILNENGDTIGIYDYDNNGQLYPGYLTWFNGNIVTIWQGSSYELHYYYDTKINPFAYIPGLVATELVNNDYALLSTNNYIKIQTTNVELNLTYIYDQDYPVFLTYHYDDYSITQYYQYLDGTGIDPDNPDLYSINIQADTAENGSVTPTSLYVQPGSSITITATPAFGYAFSHWSDGNTTNPRTLIVNENVNLIAYFIPTIPPSLANTRWQSSPPWPRYLYFNSTNSGHYIWNYDVGQTTEYDFTYIYDNSTGTGIIPMATSANKTFSVFGKTLIWNDGNHITYFTYLGPTF